MKLAKKTDMPHHNPQKVPTNFNSTMKNNARPNFTNSNSQQQKQNKQPAQQQNGDTFWTAQTTNSCQQATKEKVGSQGNSHAEKFNTNSFKNKVPVGVSRKSNVKRNRNQVEESSQSSYPTNSGNDSTRPSFNHILANSNIYGYTLVSLILIFFTNFYFN
jgi:hypothetical protein